MNTRRILFLFLVYGFILHIRATGFAQPVPDFGCKTRLPESVNSYQPSIMPVLSNDGSTLYFSRKFHPDNIGGISDPDDIWYSKRLTDSTWSEPRNAGRPLNTEGSDVLFSLMPDGTTAFIGTTIRREGKVLPCYAIADIQAGTSTQPQPIIIRSYDNSSPNHYAHLAYDGRTLLLSTNNTNGNGGLDLYVSFRIGNTYEWSAPRNLGSVINTRRTEGSPFLGYDGATLYFSSDGRKGYGSQDFFVSRRLDSTWTRWSEPENTGAIINSDGIDHCISLTRSGDSAYIVSQTETKRTSMYSICIPQHLKISAPQQQRTPSATIRDTIVVYFDTDDATPKDTLALSIFFTRILSLNGRYTLTVTPHTSARGTVAHNSALADARFQSVLNYINTRFPVMNNAINKGKHIEHGSSGMDTDYPQDRKVVIEVMIQE